MNTDAATRYTHERVAVVGGRYGDAERLFATVETARPFPLSHPKAAELKGDLALLRIQQNRLDEAKEILASARTTLEALDARH